MALYAIGDLHLSLTANKSMAVSYTHLPQYQFARHKGYGTKLHYAMLDQYGPCPEHRKSFLKKWEAGRDQ